MLHFSTDDDDSRVTELLLNPELEILKELNFALESHCDEQVLQQVLWFLSNIIGENKPEVTDILLKKSVILDFMCRVVSVY